jgi:hypothetical protein
MRTDADPPGRRISPLQNFRRLQQQDRHGKHPLTLQRFVDAACAPLAAAAGALNALGASTSENKQA